MVKNEYLEGLINTYELGLDFNILTEEAAKELKKKIEFQKTVVGRIDYINAKEEISERVDYTDRKNLEEKIKELEKNKIPFRCSFFK